MDKIPEIRVGILTAESIRFSFNGTCLEKQFGEFENINAKVCVEDDKIVLDFNDNRFCADELKFTASDFASDYFTLFDVKIGIGFHWEKKEDQQFRGTLQLIVKNGSITAVNIIPLEEYLKSVISSEMSATSSPELLKAHAVISRGWLLSQINNRDLKSFISKRSEMPAGESEIVRWYDREDHELFDVCADDHCQRYQGITRTFTSAAGEAVSLTTGEVLLFRDKLCDTRFSKCCGGFTELYENTWDNTHHPYLQKVRDTGNESSAVDLTLEENAVNWIMNSPVAFCNTNDKTVLRQVLNDYDRPTADFYRWKVSYSNQQLKEILKEKTGFDPGTVTGLVPLERGVSGRIIRLKVTGTLKTFVIGKELEIRKALSKTHLYSSAFVVEKTGRDESPGFVLYGAGWGHGVGLCQIGAAVMGSKGYSYKQILMHYFKETKLEKIY